MHQRKAQILSLLLILPAMVTPVENWLLADVVRKRVQDGARLLSVQADFVTCSQ